MQLANKDNLESALLELTRQKKLPRKLVRNLTKHPTVKLAWSSGKPITEKVISRIAEQLMDNPYYRLPHKTPDDIARQIKTCMQWKQIEKDLSSAQKPQRLQNPARATSSTGRRPIIPLAI